MADEVTAFDLGVPTYEIEVVCGPYCQGGSTKAKCCPYPEFTAAEDVWVKGSDVAALRARVAEAEERRDEHQANCVRAMQADNRQSTVSGQQK